MKYCYRWLRLTLLNYFFSTNKHVRESRFNISMSCKIDVLPILRQIIHSILGRGSLSIPLKTKLQEILALT